MFGYKITSVIFFFIKKIVYNENGDNMSSKMLKEFEGKLILLYGGVHKTKEENLNILFKSSSDNWSKDYVKLLNVFQNQNSWLKRMEKFSFLSLSMFLKIYQLFQKELYQKDDRKILKSLKLDVTKKLKELTSEEKERLLFFLQYQLDLNVYLFEEPFLHQNDNMTREMLKLMFHKLKKHKVIFVTSKYQINRMEQIVTDVLVVTPNKVRLEPISKVCHYHYSLVYIKGKNYKKLKLGIKNIILKEQTDDEIVFLYCGKFHELFEVLQSVELEDVSIRKQTLEEALQSLKIEN